ncbi:TPA: type 4b pilus protein PilO2 [Escherichia coli]|nr:type 4b pilus protein PilO2 [Escherichia coli]HBA9522835.1 type 4b pilus protein PilO2 [Escherichia coli]HBA9550772.1 type 4b pilus protein PilO2 [Escherichia coli]HBA9560239.1 type 4b pilus protein PilO2 [Escherichia coli]
MNDAKIDHMTGVVHLLKETYAINLLWDQVPQGRSPLKIAKESAKIINTSLVCLDTNLLGEQYGLADKNIGHKEGMKVLATRLDYSSGSICGVWEINENLWVILVVNRDGLIVLDKGVNSVESALEEFNNILYSDEWDRIICPEAWHVPNSIDTSLDKLFAKKCKKIKSIGFPLKSVFGILSVLSCGFLLYFFFTLRFPDVKNVSPVTVHPGTIKKNELPEKLEAPWAGKPLSVSMIEQCIKSIGLNINNAVGVPGWSWNEQTFCDGEKIFFPISKNGGTLLWLKASRQLISPPPDIINSTENSAVLAWPLASVKKYGSEELTVAGMNTVANIKEYLTSSFSQSFSVINFGTPIVLNFNEQSLLKITFNYSTKLDPRIYLPILINVEGIVVTKLTYSFESEQWQVDGEFYGRA